MTDDEFIQDLKKRKVVHWYENYPWSGYILNDTCLILSEGTDLRWYIMTREHCIVLLTMNNTELEKSWPNSKKIQEMNEHGNQLGYKYRYCNDF